MNILNFDKRIVTSSNGGIALGSSPIDEPKIDTPELRLGIDHINPDAIFPRGNSEAVDTPLAGGLVLDGKGQHPPRELSIMPMLIDPIDWDDEKKLRASLESDEMLHTYTDGSKRDYIRFCVLERAGGKAYEYRTLWRSPRGKGVWLNAPPPPANRPLFRLNKIVASPNAKIVLLANEHDVFAAEDDNTYFYMVMDGKVVFTCCRGYAETDFSPLKGHEVFVVGKAEEYPGLKAQFVERLEDAITAPVKAEVVIPRTPGRPRSKFHISEFSLSEIISKFPGRGYTFVVGSIYKGSLAIRVAAEGRPLEDDSLCIYINPNPGPRDKDLGFHTYNYARPTDPKDAEQDRNYVIETLKLGNSIVPVALTDDQKRERAKNDAARSEQLALVKQKEFEAFCEFYAKAMEGGPALTYLRETRKLNVKNARYIYEEIDYREPRSIITNTARLKLIVPRRDVATGKVVGFELNYLVECKDGSVVKDASLSGNGRRTVGRSASYMAVKRSDGAKTLAVGEGFITTCSAAQLPLDILADADIWALGSVGNYTKLITSSLPYDHFVIFVDNDEKKTGETASVELQNTLLAAGKTVTLVRCPSPEGLADEKGNWDFNDLIKLCAIEGREPVEGQDYACERKEKGSKVVITVKGVAKFLTTLSQLDAEYALYIPPKGVSVYVSKKNACPISVDDLKRRLESAVVETGTSNDRTVYTPAYPFWSGNARRHVYHEIAFTNKPVASDVMNLYTGLGVTPRAGDCELILEHYLEVISAGDEKTYKNVLDLKAWQIQNIGQPSRIIPVLKSTQHQVGKSLVMDRLMGRIYGASGFVTPKSDHVLGRFNEALLGKAYVFLEEALFAGNHQARDELKGLCMMTGYPIEIKNLPIVTCPMAVNIWMASNHDNAAFIEEKDERYWVLNVSETRHGDHAYFSKLVESIENGGREAFAHYLLTRDVSNFVPWRDINKDNAEKRKMIRASRNPFDARRWLEDCVEAREILGTRIWRETTTDDEDGNKLTVRNRSAECDAWVDGGFYTFAQLWSAYTEWQKGVKAPRAAEPTLSGEFGAVLKNAGFKNHRDRTLDGRGRGYVLPTLEECAQKLDVTL